MPVSGKTGQTKKILSHKPTNKTDHESKYGTTVEESKQECFFFQMPIQSMMAFRNASFLPCTTAAVLPFFLRRADGWKLGAVRGIFSILLSRCLAGVESRPHTKEGDYRRLPPSQTSLLRIGGEGRALSHVSREERQTENFLAFQRIETKKSFLLQYSQCLPCKAFLQ